MWGACYHTGRDRGWKNCTDPDALQTMECFIGCGAKATKRKAAGIPKTEA